MNIRKTTFAAAIAAALAVSSTSAASCPFGYDATPVFGYNRERQLSAMSPVQQQEYANCDVVDFTAVKKDITALLTNSQDFWPADFGHYGGFFIRLAWHCNGSYRKSDGRGGCDGGRIRHLPERAWADNTNLDKALDLLAPIKQKYGAALSWGDLITLAGTTAIESMGGPVLGFCGGRTDDVDGTDSVELGPSNEQDAIAHCEVNGDCKSPLGPTTIGLIYVNPEGPMGVPDPAGSAPQIRDTFGRMGMDDRETVALIGGGHAFGKTHGACPTGPGPDPIQAPDAPWPGTCGSGALKGKGNNTFTSGFEGAWTFTPTKWGNGYFKGLTGLKWEKFTGPGNHNQWRPVPDTNPPVRMLTADIALLHDDKYKAIATEFASNITALNEAFSHAWYKLTSRDMGPVGRCKGKLVPPAQPFQNPLPDSPAPNTLPNFDVVRQRVKDLLNKDISGLTSDKVGGKSYNGALFVHLAYQCAATFRITDYAGGCNGAKIRFSPQKDWEGNAGLDTVIAALEPIKKDFPTLSTADLVVIAGQVALEQAGSEKIEFIGGRVDAKDGANVEQLAPRKYYPNPLVAVRDDRKVRGLSEYEYVALAGRPRSAVQQKRLGFKGTFTDKISTVSNEFFKVLVSNKWVKVGDHEYQAEGKNIFMQDTDVALIWDSTYKAIVQLFASDVAIFKHVFAQAWNTLMTADHFNTKWGYY